MLNAVTCLVGCGSINFHPLAAFGCGHQIADTHALPVLHGLHPPQFDYFLGLIHRQFIYIPPPVFGPSWLPLPEVEAIGIYRSHLLASRITT